MIIKLADEFVNIESMHEQVREMCRGYAADADAAAGEAIVVRTSQADIEREREVAESDTFSDAYLETLAVYRQIADAMLLRGVLLVHGSALAIDGKGVILAAPSGTGKSTLARNIAKVCDGMSYVNDDKPLVRVSDGVTVYGTPWDGKHHLSNNVSVPLQSVVFVERSTEPWVKKVEACEVFEEMMKQVYKPDDAELMVKMLGLVDELGKKVEFYKIGATLDARSAELLIETLARIKPTAAQSSIEDELSRQGWLLYPNVGSSMEPLIIQNQDLMFIKYRPAGQALNKYDVVLFKRRERNVQNPTEHRERFVLHRIVGMNESLAPDGSAIRTYNLCGDNQRFIEKGIRDDQIIGILDYVIKDANTDSRRVISPNDPAVLGRVKRRLVLVRALDFARRILK